MSFLPLDLLRDGAQELGVELNDQQLDLLDRFAEMLVEANRTLNLTRITEPAEIVTGHYLDSFTCLAAAKMAPSARAIDIGTGAGFPGIPIKIARQDLDMTLLDSSLKKLKFIEHAMAALNERSGGSPSPPGRDIDGPLRVTTVHFRAEDAGRDPDHRERYDVAFARALAGMKTLVELGLPLVKVGGILIAQKSESADAEIREARPSTGQLGGRIEKIERIKIPGTDVTRSLVVISKLKPTPPGFPRPYSRIARKKER